jgi:hypothetical protein
MIGPMRFRKLRIAFSATCLIACVLLVVLWVRSLRVSDLISNRDSAGTTTTFCSSSGKIWIRRGADPMQNTLKGRNVPAHEWKYLRLDFPGNADGNWYVFHFDSASALKVQFPDATLIALCIGISLVPWFSRKRFSLRTLLIATTLVAVVLGLAVYAARK